MNGLTGTVAPGRVTGTEPTGSREWTHGSLLGSLEPAMLSWACGVLSLRGEVRFQIEKDGWALLPMHKLERPRLASHLTGTGSPLCCKLWASGSPIAWLGVTG